MKIIDIPNETLLPAGKVFNPSIVEWRNVTLMYYRYEPLGGDYNTDLAVCELDRNWKPIEGTNRPLRLTRFSSRVTTLDDPRAFIWKGKVWLAYPQGCVIQTSQGWPWACSMALARFLTPEQHDGQWLPKYGKNLNASSSPMSLIATEKNWSPFIHNERLLMVYTINPLVIVEFNPMLDQTNEVFRGAEISTSHWKWGEFLGGGTPLIKRGDEYVGFFHSFTEDHANKPNKRTYHVGFYAISAIEPFRITRISSKPIMTAAPDAAHDLRGNSSWRPNCIYPCGFLERDGKVYLSYGWQDCRCKIAEFTWEELNRNAVEVNGDRVLPKTRKKPRFKQFIRCEECHTEFDMDDETIKEHACI